MFEMGSASAFVMSCENWLFVLCETYFSTTCDIVVYVSTWICVITKCIIAHIIKKKYFN